MMRVPDPHPPAPPPRQVGHENVRHAARYFMYRKWVYHAHGPTGKGNRVRLPRCVVEFIRDRFREPGCDCLMGGPLYGSLGGDCMGGHGYSGHRAAPPAAPE